MVVIVDVVCWGCEAFLEREQHLDRFGTKDFDAS